MICITNFIIKDHIFVSLSNEGNIQHFFVYLNNLRIRYKDHCQIMGIKGINKFLKSKCPEIFEEIHLSQYAFRKIAIDTSLFLCKFKASYGDRWITAFIKLVACLRKNEIHCVFIYDTCAPDDKAAERAERKERKEALQAKLERLENDVNIYDESKVLSTFLIEFYDKQKNTKVSLFKPVASLSDDSSMAVKEEAIVNIKEGIERVRKQILNISPEDFVLTKKLFDILNVPYFDAPMEAETCCSDLCKRGFVDAVLSEDTDVLAYSANVFLSKIDLNMETCVRIHHAEMIDKLGLTENEFLDLCIMCECDYNKNIPKIGPEKSYKLLQTYKTIDEIGIKTKNDISVLRHIRCRELFQKYETLDISEVPYCGHPDFEKLTEFVQLHDVRLNLDYLHSAFVHNIVIFNDDDEDDKKVITSLDTTNVVDEKCDEEFMNDYVIVHDKPVVEKIVDIDDDMVVDEKKIVVDDYMVVNDDMVVGDDDMVVDLN